nr:T9SS type A sorting domain-containing protein [Bacteroidota bacterium]
MKLKYPILILLNLILIDAFCQKPSLELTFTSKSYLQNILLDSVNIKNLTQGGDTTIYYPDSILVLDYSLSVFEHTLGNNKTFCLSSNYPNPFNESTNFHISLLKKEKVRILVHDFMGKVLTEINKELVKGKHTFVFTSGNKSFYLLTVATEQSSQTIKMISNRDYGSNTNHCKLKYSGCSNSTDLLKSEKMKNVFEFSPGDELKYTANTYIGALSITDTPDSNMIYEFQYTGIPCPGILTITDIDGNNYNTVQIGDQCWMKENLRTITYNNGVSIPNIQDSISWSSLTTGAYVWYNNDSYWKNYYGALYNWHTVIDNNAICPSGWHVPSHEEWLMLTDFIGGWIPPYGNMLKSCRQVNSNLGEDCLTSEHPRWEAYEDIYGTDDFGFSGTPGGNRYFENGEFWGIGKLGFYWSTSEFPQVENAARLSGLLYNYEIFAHSYRHKNDGSSVRCLKD